jgi:hypothetical protein
MWFLLPQINDIVYRLIIYDNKLNNKKKLNFYIIGAI